MKTKIELLRLNEVSNVNAKTTWSSKDLFDYQKKVRNNTKVYNEIMPKTGMQYYKVAIMWGKKKTETNIKRLIKERNLMNKSGLSYKHAMLHDWAIKGLTASLKSVDWDTNQLKEELVDEGKYAYPKDVKSKGKEGRAGRKAFRKKEKAKAHKLRMQGKLKETMYHTLKKAGAIQE